MSFFDKLWNDPAFIRKRIAEQDQYLATLKLENCYSPERYIELKKAAYFIQDKFVDQLEKLERELKVLEWLKMCKSHHRLRYCTAEVCGCMGCVNIMNWEHDEPRPTKKEFDEICAKYNLIDPRQSINFSFKGYSL